MNCRLNSPASIFIASILLWSSSARADWGEDALRIQCTAETDVIVIEPFIIWNDVYLLHGIDISAIAGQPSLPIGDSIYYRIRGLPKTPIQNSCKTKTREVTMIYERGKVLINESAEGVTRSRQINLAKETRHAWDVYGPTFRLESNKPDGWLACYGREDGDTSYVTGCDPWPLSNTP
jgi:hypothetical protein